MEKEIKEKLLRLYGVKVKKLKRLVGFYDSNFEVTTEKQKYFLKIYGIDKPRAVAFQVEFMERLRKGGLPTAKVISSLDGKNLINIGNKPAVLQTFLYGKVVRKAKITPLVIKEIGKTLGRLHKISSSGRFGKNAHKKYLWDLAQFHLTLKNIPKAKKFLSANAQVLIGRVVADWRQYSKQLKKLKLGYIHNDFHDNNILTDGRKITGIMDFGDALKSWFVADLTAPFIIMIFNKDNFLPLLKVFIKGYKSEFSLLNNDWVMLPLLIRMRAVLFIVNVPLELGLDYHVMYKKFFRNSVAILKYLDGKENQQKLYGITRV